MSRDGSCASALLARRGPARGRRASHSRARRTAAARSSRTRTLIVAVDRDDDDEDGVIDSIQLERGPERRPGRDRDPARRRRRRADRDARRAARDPPGRVRSSTPLTIAADELPAPILLQATRRVGRQPPVALLVTQGGETARIPLHAVELRAARRATTGRSSAARRRARDLAPRDQRSLAAAQRRLRREQPDPDNVRVQILDSAAQGKSLTARLQAVGRDRRSVHSELDARPVAAAGAGCRSARASCAWSATRSIATRAASPARCCRSACATRCGSSYRSALGEVRQALRVGRPGDEDGPRAARRAALRAVVLRAYPGGPPVIGIDDAVGAAHRARRARARERDLAAVPHHLRPAERGRGRDRRPAGPDAAGGRRRRRPAGARRHACSSASTARRSARCRSPRARSRSTPGCGSRRRCAPRASRRRSP